jgi:hypothetical protein
MKKQLPLFFLLVSHWAFAQTEAPPFQVSEFSVWSQRVDLSAYVGKKYRLLVAIRAEPKNQEAFAIAFIRNEFPAGGLRAWTYMDNMEDHPVRDSLWKTYQLEYKVEKRAPWVGFGMLGYGNGVFYFDDLKLMVETSEGTWIELPIQNGDFESETILPWQQTVQGVAARVLGASASTSTETPFKDRRCFRIKHVFLK